MPGKEGIGPRLEQLLAVAGELQLPLELLMGDAGAAEEGVGLGNAPIGKRRGRQRQGQKQSRGDEELGLVAHDRPLGPSLQEMSRGVRSSLFQAAAPNGLPGPGAEHGRPLIY